MEDEGSSQGYCFWLASFAKQDSYYGQLIPREKGFGQCLPYMFGKQEKGNCGSPSPKMQVCTSVTDKYPMLV